MKRLFGIRHIRYFYLHYRALRWARKWGDMGLGLGYPNESDLKYLDAVWRGLI